MTPNGFSVADLIIEGAHIVTIGVSDDHRADTVIDAADLLVVPGFIDFRSMAASVTTSRLTPPRSGKWAPACRNQG